MATTDLITLAEARQHLRLPEGDTTRDAEIQNEWIPAVTPIVEDVIGAAVTRSATKTFVLSGGAQTLLLPASASSITSVTTNGVTVDPTAYSLGVRNGILTATGAGFRGTVVVTYLAGRYADTASVPKNVKLAARIILAALWRPDQNGQRQVTGNPGQGNGQQTPSGFEIPRRAYALLEPDTSVDVMAGFA